MPFVRGAHAAGKLAVGFWDHWVPGANEPLEKLCREWAEREKVDLKVDFITSNGDKDLLTAAAEAQAKTGHDILAFTSFLPARYSEQLVPLNAEMDELIKQNGKVNGTVEYLGKFGGKWLAIPATVTPRRRVPPPGPSAPGSTPIDAVYGGPATGRGMKFSVVSSEHFTISDLVLDASQSPHLASPSAIGSSIPAKFSAAPPPHGRNPTMQPARNARPARGPASPNRRVLESPSSCT